MGSEDGEYKYLYEDMIYSYDELKGRIKVGDKVSAASGKANPCAHLEKDGSNIQEITSVGENSFAINDCSHIYHKFDFLNLNPQNDMQEKTWDNLVKGDILETAGGVRKVLSVLDDVFLMSQLDSFDEADGWRTKLEAKRYNWTFQQPEITKTMTHEEVEKALGYKVAIVEA